MELTNGPWRIKNSTTKYKDEYVELIEDQVIRPDGQPGTYATVHMKPGIAVLPIDQNNMIYITKQFRYILGQDSIEVICGGIDENEPPLKAAQRETREEAGIQAKQWIDLGEFEMDTSILRNPVSLFICKDLSFTQTDPDSTEDVKRIKIPFEEAIQMVMDGRIVHSPSIVLLLKSHLYQQEQLKQKSETRAQA